MNLLREVLENEMIRLYPSDWRYSATIVGLCRFFEYNKDIYVKGEDYLIEDDYIEYKEFEVTDEYKSQYLSFVESYFKKYMHHKIIENLLQSSSELTESDVKKINEKLKANTIMKSVFTDCKSYVAENSSKMLDLVDSNRELLVQKTHATGKNLYAKFINDKKLFEPCGKICRLIGYYEDPGRKLKAQGFNQNTDTFVYNDILEFDFIPFAFTNTRVSFFINNNSTIANLLQANNNLQNAIYENESAKQINETQLLFQYKQSGFNLEYSVEIISKKIENDYFETVFVRQFALEILKSIKENEYEAITKPCRYNADYLPIQEIVVNSILNKIYLDFLIEKLFICKDKNANFSYLIHRLININVLIYGGENMGEKLKVARGCAYAIKQELAENKLSSYRSKLISALTFNDYDKFCKILLQLSDYSGVVFRFAYDLFEDFEANKNQAYAFVNGLTESKN